MVIKMMINEIMVDGVKEKKMMIKVDMVETKVDMAENVMIMVEGEKDMMIKKVVINDTRYVCD